MLRPWYIQFFEFYTIQSKFAMSWWLLAHELENAFSVYYLNRKSFVQLGQLIDIVMGNIFRGTFFAWFGGLGPKSRPF